MISTNMDLQQVLTDCSKEIFETMAFMELEKIDQQSSEIESEEALMGLITFTDGIEGCLTITCSHKCAKSIAVNMLGLDPEDNISRAEKEDALGEMTNMVMGRVKSQMEETYKDIKISVPTIVQGKNLKNYLGEGQQEASVALETEEKDLIKTNLLFRQKA